MLIADIWKRYHNMDYSEKDWNFIKNHQWKHFFADDLPAKGVSKNFSTKINESMHGPLKEVFQRRSNFKNIEEHVCIILANTSCTNVADSTVFEIVRYEMWSDALMYIHHRIKWREEMEQEASMLCNEGTDSDLNDAEPSSSN